MRIPSDKIDEIFRAADILEIIGDYVQLKKKGTNFWALSPFVKERTPSFAVNPAKGIFKCFSSGKGGNAVTFLMELEGYTYPEALLHIAKKYNIEVETQESSPEYEAQKTKLEGLYIVNQYAADFYHQQLTETEAGKQIAMAYFKERGISEATIRSFHLGYSPDAWESLAQDAIAKQYSEQYLIETGLCSRSEKTQKLVDRFRDRVMFPITNAVGKVVGFGGRILKNKDKEAKYINSPETEIYKKSQILYGLFQSRNAIREKNQCILTEGYMDVIALHQAGIHHVVASSGTSLTEEQVRLIRRFTPNVLLIYDGDEPGIKASLRAIDLLIPEGMRVKVVILPGSHDPDSYTKAFGAEGFLNYTEKYSQDFLDFKIDRIRPLGDISPDVQADLIQQIAETLAKIPDFVVQQTYLQNAALKLKVREDLLQYAVEKFRKTQFQSVKKSPQEQTIHAINESVDYNALAPLALQEKELIRVILNYSDKSFILKEFSETEEIPVLDFCMQELAELEFVNPVYEQIKNEIFLYYQEHQSFNVNPLIQHEDSRVSNLVSELLLQEFPISEKWFTEYGLEFRYDKRLDFVVQDAVIYYKYRKVLAVLEELLRVIKTATEEMQDELLEKFMYLSQIRNAIEQKKEILGAVKPDDVRD